MSYAIATSGIYGDTLNECVACTGGKIRFWRQKHHQYTNGAKHEPFQIYRCDQCGTGFLNQPPHASWLQAIYAYSGQALTQPITLDEVLAREVEFPNCTVDAKRMTRHAHQLNQSKNNAALDIGSGFGFCTQALTQLGYQTVSINPGYYENAVFEALNNKAPLNVMYEGFQTNQKFGVVVMSQVLEHMLEPNQAIRKTTSLLASGGVLVCAVPNYTSFLVKLLGTKDNACLWIPEHVNFFTEQGLKALLERNGLQVIKTEQVTRIPFNSLSKRLGLTGWLARAVDITVKWLQLPLAKLVNALGMGIYINLYAKKP